MLTLPWDETRIDGLREGKSGQHRVRTTSLVGQFRAYSKYPAMVSQTTYVSWAMWSKTVEVAASIDALHESCYHAIYNLDYSITKTKALNTFFCIMYPVLYLILDYWSTGHMTSIEYLYYCTTTPVPGTSTRINIVSGRVKLRQYLDRLRNEWFELIHTRRLMIPLSGEVR